MQKIAVLTDSGCDVPRSAAETYNIHILPLKITYSGKTYTDNVDIAPRDVYDRFPREIPKTSTPNVAEIADMLDVIRSEGYTHVLCVCISSGLSGTYQTVCSALKEETSLVTYAFDSKNISIGAGIFALLAAEMAARGESFETIVETLERKRTDAKLFYYMDTLDYLVAGGRIGRVAGLVGGILKLKPIISCNEDGVYYPVGILKNKKRGVAKLIECAARFADGNPCELALMNGDAEAEAAAVAHPLLEAIPQGTIKVRGQIAASLAVHTGPGLIGILVFRTDI